MSTSVQPAAVLRFKPPEPLNRYAHVTVFAETPQAWNDVRAMLIDAGHQFKPQISYASTEMFIAVWWNEGEVSCSMHGPKGFLGELDES